jgi:ankyrin repeat protein
MPQGVHGAQLEEKSPVRSTTAFFEAAVNGHLNVCEFLRKCGANIHVHDGNGLTPLHLGAANGRHDICQYLVRLGVNSNPVLTESDGKNRTPLFYAAANGNISIIKLLVDNGADVNHVDVEQTTPIEIAVLYGHFCAVKYLTWRGACLPLLSEGSLPPTVSDANKSELLLYSQKRETREVLIAFASVKLVKRFYSSKGPSSLRLFQLPWLRNLFQMLEEL